ncbi:MAG: EFR1 family ferrodoxin [Acholeplasmatales bacterium]|nr:EFR1 family ferrodoxin [Acholeplasmatales bacterium]
MIIAYFSATGNTQHLCTKLAEGLGISSVSLESLQVIEQLALHQQIIIAFPIYGSTMPENINGFIKDHQSLWKDKEIFVLVTCGFIYGSAIANTSALFSQYGATIIGSEAFVMPDNIGDSQLIYTLLPPKRNTLVLQKADQKLETLITNIRQGNYPLVGVNKKVKESHYKTVQIKVDRSKCHNCGLCRINCPSPDHCISCYRCFNICPQRAITIIGKKVLTQYLHPDFKVKSPR